MEKPKKRPLDELIEFCRPHIPDSEFPAFSALMRKCLADRDTCDINDVALIRRLAEQRRHALLESDALWKIMSDIEKVCDRHNITVLFPCFKELARVYEEFDAPLPSIEEFRQQVRNDVEAESRRRRVLLPG